MASDRVFHPQHEPDQRSAAVPAIAEKPDLNRLCQQDAEDPEVCSSLSPQNYTLISISLLRYDECLFFLRHSFGIICGPQQSFSLISV